jgi:hypothetical protein
VASRVGEEVRGGSGIGVLTGGGSCGIGKLTEPRHKEETGKIRPLQDLVRVFPLQVPPQGGRKECGNLDPRVDVTPIRVRQGMSP